MNSSDHSAPQFYKCCYAVQVHSGSGARFLSLGERSGLLYIVAIAALTDLNFDLWSSFMLALKGIKRGKQEGRGAEKTEGRC